MLLALLPAVTIAGPPPDSVLSTEWDVLREVNRVRANHGLAELQMADEVRDLARFRSRDMKRNNYFSHVSPSGAMAGQMLSARGIGYRLWGEVIGWTKYFPLADGVGVMVDWWMNSPNHRPYLLSRDFNYAGVGIAQDGPQTLWTIVFVNQADRTAPVAGVRAKRVVKRSADSVRPATALLGNRSGVATDARTTLRWWGRDPKLSTRTAGLHSFTLQHKVPGGRWHTIRSRTTQRQGSWYLRPGTAHVFRIRARDRAGNTGEWRRLWLAPR